MAKEHGKPVLSMEAAKQICSAHDIAQMMDDEEERELLRENNNRLYWAYVSILQIAYPDDARWNP